MVPKAAKGVRTRCRAPVRIGPFHFTPGTQFVFRENDAWTLGFRTDRIVRRLIGDEPVAPDLWPKKLSGPVLHNPGYKRPIIDVRWVAALAEDPSLARFTDWPTLAASIPTLESLGRHATPATRRLIAVWQRLVAAGAVGDRLPVEEWNRALIDLSVEVGAPTPRVLAASWTVRVPPDLPGVCSVDRFATAPDGEIRIVAPDGPVDVSCGARTSNLWVGPGRFGSVMLLLGHNQVRVEHATVDTLRLSGPQAGLWIARSALQRLDLSDMTVRHGFLDPETARHVRKALLTRVTFCRCPLPIAGPLPPFDDIWSQPVFAIGFPVSGTGRFKPAPGFACSVIASSVKLEDQLIPDVYVRGVPTRALQVDKSCSTWKVKQPGLVR